MTTLLLHRARAQWPLLFALLVVLMVGATLLGTCALLVTRSSEKALEVAAAEAPADDVDVTAYTVSIPPGKGASVAVDTRKVLTTAIAPFTVTTATRASTVMRELPIADKGGITGEGYLSGIEGLQSRADLISGRWPRATAKGAPLEADLLEHTADLLGLKVGSKVRLGEEMTRDPADPLEVVVVGVIRPLPDAGWDRDPLLGAGYDPNPEDNTPSRQVHAYGPFVVDLNGLLSGGSALNRLEVTAHPDLSKSTGTELDALTADTLVADRKLAGTLGDRVQIERVASQLPQTLLDARGQQQLTGAAVFAVALIGVVLTAIALALAGRLTAGVRADESALLASLGTSRGQFAAAAVVESGALAVVAALLSVPASSFLHSGLTHLPPLSGARLTTAPAVTGAQIVAVAVGALALAALLVGLAVRSPGGSGDRRTRRELLARSGGDVLLVALAAAGWWQLRAQPAAGGTRADTVRVLAPALLLTAGTALALRVIPPALRGGERLARRARGLVLPLAAFEAARRPQAIAAGLLIGLACAAGTFGIAFAGTWHASQHDQADMSVGTDFTIGLTAPPVTGQSAAITAATGGVVSPAAQHAIAVGQWLGGSGAAPQLLAIDTRNAGSLLRGRLGSGRTWASVGTALTPTTPVAGIDFPPGTTPTLSGTASGPTPVTVTPRLLLQDATGLRTSCAGPVVPLDGKPHAVPGCAKAAGLRLVSVALAPDGMFGEAPSNIDATLALPSSAQTWSAEAASPEGGQLTSPAVSVTARGVRISATVLFGDDDASDKVVVATAFPDPGDLPVVASSSFAAQVGGHIGSKLSITFDNSPVPVKIVGIVPTVPSEPGAAAILADVDSLTRALIVRGDYDSPVDAWWIGSPTHPDAAGRVAALHVGTVTTRAAETARLLGSPLRAALPAILRVLVVATALLLLGGVILHVTCDLQLRALEVARLRGIGMSRRDIRNALLGEHAAVLLPHIAAGAIVGALATWVVGPLLVRSDTGAAPVPSAEPQWPWPLEASFIGVLVVGCAIAVSAVVAVQVRRADAAHLRVAS